MDQENKKPTPESTDLPENQDLLDAFLSSDDTQTEIGPDEQAVYSAGLTDISDAEIDKIIEETLAETPEDIPDTADEDQQEENSQMPEPFRDEEYRDTFGEGEELEAVFEDTPAVQEPAPESQENAPVRKRRPRHKSGYGLLGIPHILATAIWLIIVVAIGVSLGRAIWVATSDVLAFGREDHDVTITITDDDNLDSIAQKLKQANLIRYPGLFKMFAELTGAEEKEKISTGTFTLNTLYDYSALINSMNTYSSAREEVKVMIPEGYTCSQIFRLLEENNVCAAADLEAYAANGELDDYWFLENVQRGNKDCLEGYLFPDTYKFYLNDDPERVLEKFLNNFDVRFNDKMKESLVTLNDRLSDEMRNNGYDDIYIQKNQMTIEKIVILASLVEKETATVPEAYTISSVIYNRLHQPGEPHLLNIDASLIYALHGNIDPATGLTKPLTEKDTQMDHPYNTYIHPGLTPGAISNPGLNSLNAALDPDDTNYYYYALNPNTGVHEFFRTYQEHLNFLASLED